MKKRKRKIRLLSLVGEMLLWALALFCVSYAVTNVIDSHTNYSCSFFGYRTSVIVSGSMENKNPENDYLTDSMKRIEKDSIIIAKETSYEDIEIYDVVLHVESGNLICHRVIDKYESNGIKYLVTRGDSNNLDDAPFAFSLCKGKVFNVIPKVGHFVLFLQSGYFLVALFFSIFLVAGTLFLLSLKKDKKEALASKNEMEVIDADQTVEETQFPIVNENDINKQSTNIPRKKIYRIHFSKDAKPRKTKTKIKIKAKRKLKEITK